MPKYIVGQDRETGKWTFLEDVKWTKEAKYSRSGRRNGSRYVQYGIIPCEVRSSPFFKDIKVVEADSKENACLSQV